MVSVSLLAQRAATVALLALIANHFRPLYPLIQHAFIQPLPSSPVAQESCRIIRAPNLEACEDIITWDREDGTETVIASCDPGRWHWNTVMGPTHKGDSSGGLHLLSPDGEVSPLNLTNLPANFTLHPLGLSIWLEIGHDRLFVVNHGKEMSTVEVFDLVEGSQPQARWVASLKGADWQGIIAPNSIVAISATSFYLTHDHFLTRRTLAQQMFPFNLLPTFLDPIVPVLNTLETYLLLRTGSVTYNTFVVPPHVSLPTYMRSRPVVEGVPFANGLAISPEGTHALLASTSTSKIYLYAIDGASERFKFVAGWDTPFHPDNIAWDEVSSGSVALIAGHRSSPLVSKIGRTGRKDVPAPSFVSAIVFPPEIEQLSAKALGEIPLKTLYTNAGDFGTSTSAELDSEGALWVAGLYQDGILRCQGAHVPLEESDGGEWLSVEEGEHAW